jgi:hypothetical protein
MALLDFLSPVFGKKPTVPQVTPTNLAQAQRQAVGENITAFPQIAQLGNLYTSYLRNQLPTGFGALGGQAVTGISNLLGNANQLEAGQIPADVAAQVQRSDAYQSLMSGEAGSPMSRGLTARDLGLTSLQLMGQGAQLGAAAGNAAQEWQNISLQTAMNPSSMFVTPAQQAAITAQNNELKWQQQWLQNQINAARNPVIGGLSDIVETLTAAYLSHGMGGGTTNNATQTPQANMGGGSFGGGGGGTSFGGAAGPVTTNPFNDYQPIPSDYGDFSPTMTSFGGGNTIFNNPFDSPPGSFSIGGFGDSAGAGYMGFAPSATFGGVDITAPQDYGFNIAGG